jgi:KDO2-lipid IV(A) lauroyltransferase
VKPLRKLAHAAEFVLFRIASSLVEALPLSWAQSVGRLLGWMVYRLFGFRRGTTRENLRRSYPELSSAERERIAVDAYQSVGVTLLELVWQGRMTEDDLRSMVRIDGLDVLKKRVVEGKGVVVLTAHIGNWEIITLALKVLAGISVEALYKPQSNSAIDKAILSRRTRFGTTLIPMGMSIREILRILQGGGCILIAADQSAPMESIHVRFFGREVPVFQGPAAFCLKTGAALVAAYALRGQDGTYMLECREIPTKDLPNDDHGVEELTRRQVRATEEIIRRYPGQWMWMHRRWKHSTEQHEPV